MDVSVRFIAVCILLWSCELEGRAVLHDEGEVGLSQEVAGARASRNAAPLEPRGEGIAAPSVEDAGLNHADSGGDESPRENPSAGQPAADSGGDTDAGRPGIITAEGPAAASPSQKLSWACAQLGRICECVKKRASEAHDACDIPRPTCCYTLPENRCLCVPNGGNECQLLDAEAEAERVSACPH